MKKILVLKFLILSFLFSSAQTKHTFSLTPDNFLLDNKPFQIISGEMHPARIPHEYWRHRIQMAKAMGCNTISLYVFWNFHEVKEGVFDFKTGEHNLAEFIRTCQQENMWVLVRPGPYVCAEWDFGGLPSYLLKIPDIRIRCNDQRYMAAVKRYIYRLSSEIKPLLCTNGGPILMLQVENEYGSYGNDREYINALGRIWKEHGINVPFFTGDGPAPALLEAGHLEGAAIGLDPGRSEADFNLAKKMFPDVPSFSSEIYPGWLTHWGEKFARADTTSLKKDVEFLLKNKKSFNLYVIHGGTNFGFSAGANAFSPIQYQPDITSYDYDAPINEQGQPTPKYFMLRNLINRYSVKQLVDIPVPVKTIEIPPIRMRQMCSIWQQLEAPFHSPHPLTMEALGQREGFILYSTKLVGHKGGKLTIREPHDFALVFLNHKFIDTIYRDGGKWTIDLPAPDPVINNPELEILVEGMGRINYGEYMMDRKGITERVTLNGMTLMNWIIYSLPLDPEYVHNIASPSRGLVNDKQGIFSKGIFTLTETGDTYFDMRNWSKGVLYVNGHNLGRYWNRGPQQRLYCPGVWLKKGENEIIVFELLKLDAASIHGRSSLSD